MTNGVTENVPVQPEGGATDASPEVQALQAALTAAETTASGNRDQHLRAVAELDNVRKRAQRDIENAHRYSLERFALELLPVRDSLELAVAASAADAAGPMDAAAATASMREGQQATLDLLTRAFDRFSITRISPLGERFDPTQQEAVMVQESADATPDSVLQVVQSGYDLNGRLLRPARVIVAKAPAA